MKDNIKWLPLQKLSEQEAKKQDDPDTTSQKAGQMSVTFSLILNTLVVHLYLQCIYKCKLFLEFEKMYII